MPFLQEINDQDNELQEQFDKHEDKASVDSDDFESVNLGSDDDQKWVRIGKTLSVTERQAFIDFLRPRVHCFAFSYEDMPGLDTDLVKHQLPIKEGVKPIKQKLRRLRPEWIVKIREEVMKQYNAGFLIVSTYPEWLANLVPVPKKDGRVRMCIDFRDLNRASPKDDFPLPHIDILVDNTANQGLLSFMDGFSGYNKIKMAESDREKTSFITPWGTYCYKVMPFGLKNAGATYL